MTHRAIWLLMAALSLVALIPGLRLPVLTTGLLAVALAIVPGSWVARRLRAHTGSVEQLQLGIVLSPLLVGVPVAALVAYAGWSIAAAGRVVVVAFALLCAWEAFRPQSSERVSTPRVAWVPGALWAGVTLAFLLLNPVLAPRSDGWFHSAVTLQISGLGVPPEDPYFAGLPLLYFWGAHAWAATWLAIQGGTSVWAPLITLNVVAALAVVLGVCAIAARLGAGPRGQWWAAAVAVAGYAPFAWLIIVARASIGEVTGLDELQRIVAGGGASIRDHMKGGMLDSSMVFFGDKYLVLTPFGLGLALICSMLMALWDLTRSGLRRTAVVVGLLQMCALFVHTFVAFVTGILGAAVWGIVLVQRLVGGRRHATRVLVLLALAMIGATAVLYPYVSTVLAGKREVLPWGVSFEALFTLIHGGLLVVPLGAWWLWRERGKPIGSIGLLSLAIVTAAFGLIVGLPGANQSKFFNVLFLLLSAPAGALLAEWDGRFRGSGRLVFRAGLAFAIVPTFLISLGGYVIESGEGAWHAPTAAEREALAWVVEETPPGAVFVDRSGASDLIGLTGRSVIWGNEWGERDWGVDPAGQEARRQAARELAAGVVLSAGSEGLLQELDRPVFIMARRSAAGDSASAWNRLPGRDGYASAFVNDDVVFYRYGSPELLEAGP